MFVERGTSQALSAPQIVGCGLYVSLSGHSSICVVINLLLCGLGAVGGVRGEGAVRKEENAVRKQVRSDTQAYV